MKKNLLFYSVVFILVATTFSCNTVYQSQALQYKTYRINQAQKKDSTVLAFLQPYSREVNSLMNGVVGYAEKSLDKKFPEGELGNFMADAYLHMGREKYNIDVDAAFMNFGGIRLNQLPKGDITTGRIFELMPFDNLLIIQKVTGAVLQEFLDLTATQGGWPVAGITMQIKNNPDGQTGRKAINVLIGGKPIDPEKTYSIINSDYIANGGGDVEMLKSIPQISNGYLMRDALFDYIKKLKSQGKNINANIENRVTYAE